MSKNVTPIAIFALTISYVLAGCSGGGAAANSIRKAKEAVITDEYAFEYNGCSTGKHQFKGSSQVEVLNKKCEALRDSVRNKSCAEMQRKAEFTKICKGPWEQEKPQSESNNKAAPNEVTKFSPTFASPQVAVIDDGKLDSQLQASLQKLTEKSLVGRVLVKDLEKSEDKEYFKDLIQSFNFCSFSNLGSSCLDSSANGIREAFIQNSSSFSYVVEFQQLGRNLAPVILKFEIVGEIKNGTFDEKNAFVKNVTMLESLVRPRRESLEEYVQHSTNVREVALIEIASRDVRAGIIKNKLEKPSNLREFIHMMKYFEKDATVFLSAIIKNNPDLILKSQDSLYQQHFISLLLENAKTTVADAAAWVNQLLSSSDLGVKRAAGSFLFLADQENPELRRLSSESLDHSMWQVRRAAVLGLSKTNLSKEEENRLLNLLIDVSEVKELIRQLAFEKFKLTAENVPTLEHVQKNSPQSRGDVFSLLKKIDDMSATRVLISMLEGEDNKLSRRIFEELNRRPLQSDDRVLLRKIIEDQKNTEDARVYAVRLLAKINSPESIKDIQELRMIIKTESVKEEIEYSLK